MDIVQILSIAASLCMLIFVLELIRRGALREKYALLWLIASSVFLILSVWRKLLDTIAAVLGIYYSPSLLFLLGFGFLILITLHFFVVVSRLNEKNKKLTQEFGVIKEELERIKKSGMERKGQ